jgi:hypothetical protein
MPLERPLIPMHLFANKDFVVVNILSAVGGVVYYSANSKHKRNVLCLPSSNCL